jgi:hypothetical protein
MTFTQVFACAIALYLAVHGVRGLWRGEMPMGRNVGLRTETLPALRGWRAYLASAWLLVAAASVVYVAFRGWPAAFR